MGGESLCYLTLGSALPFRTAVPLLVAHLLFSKELTVKGALDRSPETWVQVVVLFLVGLVALGRALPSLGLRL